MVNDGSEISVVHLVRSKNGIEPLRNFLSTYRNCRAGMNHDLVFVLKGFQKENLSAEFEALINTVSHKRLFVGDWGYDITAYFRAAARFESRYFCFLNSFSEILAEDWLLKLYLAINHQDIGLVGATGSYQGFHPDWKLMPHREKLFWRARWKEFLLKVPFVEKLSHLRHRLLNPVFPNPHVRTNAFLISRETMMSLRPKITLTKRGAYLFESGKNGMSRQVLLARKVILVVGKDGRKYGVDDWRGSRTFWEADQENLLIADNQTRRYGSSESDMREILSWYAWGASPGSDQPQSTTPGGLGVNRISL